MADVPNINDIKKEINKEYNEIDSKRDVVAELEKIRENLDKFYDEELTKIGKDPNLYLNNEQKKEAILLSLEEKEKDEKSAFEKSLQKKVNDTNKTREMLVKYSKEVLLIKNNILVKSEKKINDIEKKLNEEIAKNEKELQDLDVEENQIKTEHPDIDNEINTLENEKNAFETSKNNHEAKLKILEKEKQDFIDKKEKIEQIQNRLNELNAKDPAELTDAEKNEINSLDSELNKPENDISLVEDDIERVEKDITTFKTLKSEAENNYNDRDKKISDLNKKKIRLSEIGTKKQALETEKQRLVDESKKVNELKTEFQKFSTEKTQNILEQKEKFKEEFKKDGIDFVAFNSKDARKNPTKDGEKKSEDKQAGEKKEGTQKQQQASAPRQQSGQPGANASGIVNNPQQQGGVNLQQPGQVDTKSREYLINKFRSMQFQNEILSEFAYDDIVKILPALSNKEKKIINKAVVDLTSTNLLSETEFNNMFSQFNINYSTYQKLSNPENFSEFSKAEITELKGALEKFDSIKDTLNVDIKSKFDENFVKAVELGTLYESTKEDKMFTRVKKAISKKEKEKVVSKNMLMGACCNYESVYLAQQSAPALQVQNSFSDMLKMGINPPEAVMKYDIQSVQPRTMQPRQTPPTR